MQKYSTPSNECKDYQTLRKHQPSLSEQVKQNLTSPNSKPPHIYGLPKIHKPDVPLSLCKSLYQKLSKFLLSIDSPLVGHAKSFINKPSHFRTPAQALEITDNGGLVSFNFQSLFANIPVPKTLSIIQERLE
ncbi:hypothetical protein PR048_011698 [Dryococelus australis]|uniref:Reverse transcriptase n=1 Tax=Dryococelus australis TaxID=614101 RepID=A0ABQ9HMI1_9NEOP|nr:hypothetical protein PR048_011698 [Dryococelus australis]